MTALPALLYVFDKPLEKTVFKKRKKKEKLKKQTVWARALAALESMKNAASAAGAPQGQPPPLPESANDSEESRDGEKEETRQ